MRMRKEKNKFEMKIGWAKSQRRGSWLLSDTVIKLRQGKQSSSTYSGTNLKHTPTPTHKQTVARTHAHTHAYTYTHTLLYDPLLPLPSLTSRRKGRSEAEESGSKQNLHMIFDQSDETTVFLQTVFLQQTKPTHDMKLTFDQSDEMAVFFQTVFL